MADDKAGDMDFNFSDANFDMSAAGGDFEMPSMDLGDAGGDFKFDAGDDGGFNFGAADGDDAAGGGATGGGDFNFDNMSMPSFSGADDAGTGDKKDEQPGAAASAASKTGPKITSDTTRQPISMTDDDDPLNSIADMPDIPMSRGMSQGSSQGSQRQGGSQGRSKSQRSQKSRKAKDDVVEGAKKSTNVGGVTTSSRVTPAKTRRAKTQQPQRAADEEQKGTPAKDVSMGVQLGAGGGEGSVCAKRKATVEGETMAKKPKTPKQQGAGESLRATKDMMRAGSATADEGASAAPGGAANGGSTSQLPPQTPMDAKKEKRSSHKSSGKSRSSKKRPSASGAPPSSSSSSSHQTPSASSAHHHHTHKSDKKHKSKSSHNKDHRSKEGGDSNKTSHQETPRSGAQTENENVVSLQEIVSEAQARMNDITETMTRIEKDMHQKTTQLATNFVQQMFGMCNNFGMSCQQQILMMNQVAYRNDQLRKNVCKALELSNRLRGMQQMKTQLSSIKDSFCPNL